MSTVIKEAAHPPIFFVCVDIKARVHMKREFYTKQLLLYACAETPKEAERAALLWLKPHAYVVQKVAVRPASHQEIDTYKYPYAIINLPKEALASIYDKRGYPDVMRTAGSYVDVIETAPSPRQRRVWDRLTSFISRIRDILPAGIRI